MNEEASPFAKGLRGSLKVTPYLRFLALWVSNDFRPAKLTWIFNLTSCAYFTAAESKYHSGKRTQNST